MYHFCTYFDHRYLPRGLALHESLSRHCPTFRLWILCLDDISHSVLQRMELPSVSLIDLRELEGKDAGLLHAKGNRTPIDYYFTLTPCLPLHILRECSEVDLITYLDADLFFFSDPAPLLSEMQSRSIGVIPHRFPETLIHLEVFGKFNVGWVSFRRDAQGIACLEWWRMKCLEWCHDRIEDGRFADQKYLDEWPDLFDRLVTLKHKGANLAPWNVGNYTLTGSGNEILVDRDPLIFYHFHLLQTIHPWLYYPTLDSYQTKLRPILLRRIYQPYLRTLQRQARSMPLSLPGRHGSEFLRGHGVKAPPSHPRAGLERFSTRLNWAFRILRGIIERRFVLFLLGRTF